MGRPQLEASYAYDDRRYLFDVIIPGALGAVGLVVAAALLLTSTLVPIALLLLVVCSYVVLNTFFAHAYPRTVSVADGVLRLESFGRVDEWPLDQVERMSVRENASSRSVYVRLGGASLLRGRYFLGCGDMYDETGARADELFGFLLDMEAYLHPDSLRVRSRRVEHRDGASGR